jgi:proline iminopeptidase
MNETLLYPEITPYQTGYLQVSSIHNIYYEECGNKHGKPILFLHGGPGTGTDSGHRRYFDPEAYRIILVDQRGAGKSTPYASTVDNTTWDLVEDLEKLKNHLQIEKWVVFGGSWGSTLSLAYAITYPKSIKGLILRGIFLCSSEELKWFFEFGASQIFPEYFEKLKSLIDPSESIIEGYSRLLHSPIKEVSHEAARVWVTWEARALRLLFDQELFAKFTDPEKIIPIAKIECHYFKHHAFFPTPNWILDNVHRLDHFPIEIVHGRYDMVCPFKSAHELKKRLPHAKLTVVEDAGHTASEPGILKALIRATQAFQIL